MLLQTLGEATAIAQLLRVKHMGRIMQKMSLGKICWFNLEIMDSSVCLGGQEGGSDLEIRHRIETTKSCMTLLDKYTWRSSVSLDTKIGLYRAYILPVLLCGSETWTITKELCRTVVYWESLLQAVDVAHDVCDDGDSMLTHSGFHKHYSYCVHNEPKTALVYQLL